VTQAQLLQTLKQPTIDQDTMAVGFEQVSRTCDRSGAAEERERQSHGVAPAGRRSGIVDLSARVNVVLLCLAAIWPARQSTGRGDWPEGRTQRWTRPERSRSG